MTVATYQREHKVDFGVLDLAGRACDPVPREAHYTYSVSMGVYAVSTKTLRQYMAGYCRSDSTI